MRRCPTCGTNHDHSNAYCRLCANAYMREWRKTHPLTAEQARRDTCRSYANVYQRRGILRPKPCEVCGEKVVQKHHDDYTKPLEVRWRCAFHHRQLHRERRAAERAATV